MQKDADGFFGVHLTAFLLLTLTLFRIYCLVESTGADKSAKKDPLEKKDVVEKKDIGARKDAVEKRDATEKSQSKGT